MKLDEILLWCIKNNITIKSGYLQNDFVLDRKTVALSRLGSQTVTRNVSDIELTSEAMAIALNECVEEFKSKYGTHE